MSPAASADGADPLLGMPRRLAAARLRRIPVRVPGREPYDVLIGRGLELAPHLQSRRLLLFHDARLSPPRLPAGARTMALPMGERAKTFRAFARLIDAIIAADDGSPLILGAFGGGAVGDVVGFAAATYRRGMPFLQMPTTLLAMVDASVGGKTAINHPAAKNMIGAFHQPVAVLADLDRLRTLHGRELRAGLAEVVKHGLIGDRELFDALERRPEDFATWDSPGIATAVERSVRLKAAVVRKDERETRGVRESLNLGHTLGHAVETVHGHRGILHGEAVSLGIAAALRVSERLLGFAETGRAEAVLAALGLPIRLKGESARALLEAARRDKKRRTGRIRMTLLDRIGRFRVVDGIEERLFLEAAAAIGAKR
jgi:3-dehydroquinate synthase